MKRLSVLPILFFLLGVESIYAQQPVQIQGSTFFVNCNKETMTAEICDYSYRIDDREYPMYVDTRRIKGLPKKGVNTLIIPETVNIGEQDYTITAIGRAAFAGYTNFSYVNIPGTVRTIGEYAFYRTSLTVANIPVSVLSIGDRAFGYCEKLKSIRLPHKDVELEGDLFDGNVVLTVESNARALMPENQTVHQPDIKATTTGGGIDVDVNVPTTSKTNDLTFVVIVANENYVNESKVCYAINDGRVFKEYCINTLGVPEKNIHIAEDATLNNMRSELTWLSRVASVYEGEARIIVYYAGHGIPNEATGTAYLLPVDGVGTDAHSGYSLKSFYAELGKMSAQSVTVFMDACFSGSQRGEGMLASSRGVAIKAKEETPMGNLVVFSATQGDETAFPYEEKGHGLFTYFLLKKLQETKGEVTLEELGSYLKKQVSRHAIVVNNKPQTPSMSSSAALTGKLKNMKLK